MRIMLINLRTKGGHAFLNLGILYIAAVVRQAGHQVKLVDLVRSPLSDAEIITTVNDFHPDIIAFSGIITTYYLLEHLSLLLKKEFPNIPQLLGGSVGISALKTVESFTDVDFVCAGEGEVAVIRMLEELSAKKLWDTVPNIYYREGKLFRPSAQQAVYIENLDSLPWPAYDLVDMEFYIAYTSHVFNDLLSDRDETRTIAMVFSRGCPFSCSFCFRLVKKWRHHSASNILSHMRYLKERFGIGGISLNDELVFVDRSWFISLCEAISASELNFKFACGGGKPSLVTEEMVVAMKRAGFRRIGYGTESGSPKILELMNKQVSLEENYHAMELTVYHGLQMRTNLVFGHFGENKKTVNETLTFMDSVYRLWERYDLRGDYFQVWFATAYPGSPLYDWAFLKGLIRDEREYLLKATNPSQYLLNLSDFRSTTHIRNYVMRGFAMLEMRKYLRRKQYKEAFIYCLKFCFLFVFYYITLGQFASRSDLVEAIHPRKDMLAQFLELLRKK